MNSRRWMLLITVIAAAWIAVWVVGSRTKTPKSADPRAKQAEVVGSTTPLPPSSAAPRASPSIAADDATIKAKWGDGKGELGRTRQSEGNAEGPMSFARHGDELFVLDQVNGRVVRYDKRGNVIGSFPASNTTQDIEVAKDGTVLLLDRLKERTVRLIDANGNAKSAIAIPEDRVKDSGEVTGVFTDGKDVYLEQQHGALTRIGSTDGSLVDPALLSGRPSKDGQLLVSATLTGAKLTLNAFDRATGTLRFARAIPFPRPAEAVALLDTDAAGVIYAGVTTDDAVNVACMDPSDGHVIGRVAIATDAMPEEQFRAFAVADNGDIESSFRTDEGAEYHSARCAERP